MYCIMGLRTSLLLLFFSVYVRFSFFPYTLNDEIFVKDFSETVRATVVIFGMQVDNDVLYRGIANHTVGLRTSLLLLILPCIYLFFFLSTFLSKISPQLYTGRIETSNLVYSSQRQVVSWN